MQKRLNITNEITKKSFREKNCQITAKTALNHFGHTSSPN